MRTLWLNCASTESSRAAIGVERLPYPLCYNLPNAAWRVDERELVILTGTQEPTLHLDVLFEVVAGADSSLEVGPYRLALGIADQRFVNSVKLLTTRDRGVSFYYARWGTGHNLVSPALLLDETTLLSSEIVIQTSHSAYPQAVAYDHRASEMLPFLNSFTTLNEGDFVSLGSFPLPIALTDGQHLRVQVAGWEWQVRLQFEGGVAGG